MNLTTTQALHRGVAAHKAGKLQEAERFYRAILASEPNQPSTNHDTDVVLQAYSNLGMALQQKGELDSAIENYKQAIKIKPDYAEVYYIMGLAFRDKGDLKASIDCYLQAVEITPNNVDALNNLGIKAT